MASPSSPLPESNIFNKIEIPGRHAIASPALFFGFHCLTGVLLIAELVRLTAPSEFLWIYDSPFWTDGGSLTGIIFAGLSVLLVIAPRLGDILFRAAPPLVLAAASAFNLAGLHSLSWWVIITAGLTGWGTWLAQTWAAARWRHALIPLTVMNYGVLLFLYLDAKFFAITNNHLGLVHFWFLQFKGIFAAAGISPETQRGLLFTGTGYVVVTMGLGFLLRDRLRPPGWLSGRLTLAAILCVIQFLQFEALAAVVPLQEYLSFRFTFGTRLVPQAAKFTTAEFSAAQSMLPTIDETACYASGTFRWRGNDRLNLVILLVESWRADLMPESMPALTNRAANGLWLRNHFAQANSSPPTVGALFHGWYPFNYMFHAGAVGEPAFFRFLRDAGYQCSLVHGGPPDGLRDIRAFLTGFRELHPPAAAEDWPGTVVKALEAIPEILSASGPHLIFSFLYNTHFDYRYPPEYEQFRPVLPEGTDMLSLVPTPETVERMRNRYRNALGFLDDRLERFFRRLEESGASGNTWVLLVGDHGESLGDAGFFAHATGPHVSQYHVPCLIFGPNLPPARIDAPTQHVDILPTLGGLMGFDVNGLPGRDARTASRAAALSFDYSAERRVIVRTPARMSMFDYDSAGRFRWVLTMRNDFVIDAPLFEAYSASAPGRLAGLVRQDAELLRLLLSQK